MKILSKHNFFYSPQWKWSKTEVGEKQLRSQSSFHPCCRRRHPTHWRCSLIRVRQLQDTTSSDDLQGSRQMSRLSGRRKKLQRGEDNLWSGCLRPSPFLSMWTNGRGQQWRGAGGNLWRLLSFEVVCVLRGRYETFPRWLITTCECNQRSDSQTTAEEQMIQWTGFVIKASDKSFCPKRKEAQRDIWMLQNEGNKQQ